MFVVSSSTRRWPAAAAVALALLLALIPAPHAGAQATLTYTNPLQIQIPSAGQPVSGSGHIESCADPSIIRGQQPGDTSWYIYCTSDPLNAATPVHFMPILSSPDLVHWTYAGDVFANLPSWAAGNAGLWAPDIHFFNGKYYLYYTASDTSLPGGGSAIGVAVSPTPTGPWTDSGAPVVEPQDVPGNPGTRRWVYDPMEVEDAGQRFIFYGSYTGGISARKLSADGLHSDPASQTRIAIANRYEGTFIVKHAGFWYFFGSATNCCNGPLTGYSVFAARSSTLLGPYVDRDGVSILDSRVGGTPVISMNGNRWVGPGHNAVFTDLAGQDWFLYHAVDQTDPYFAGTTTTKRPVLMDPLDWVDGWPTVRGGLWTSDTPQPAPVAQPGGKSAYQMQTAPQDSIGAKIGALSDEFNGHKLAKRWRWVRRPASSAYGEKGGVFRLDTEAADLYVDTNNASVLTEAAPAGSYAVETKVQVNVPASGCCYNYVQAGLVLYKNDDNFIKLADVSIWETRQTEFAKELFPVKAGYPRYGNSVVGPPGDWAYLRVDVVPAGKTQQYTAYTSRDGASWVRGGAWTHNLGAHPRIGLVSMGGSGFTARFDYVHVYRLQR